MAAYVAILAITVFFDALPVIGLPAWMVMVVFWTQFDLDPWLVLGAGVTGSTAGRVLFGLYAPRVSRRFLRRDKNDELAFVGRKLEGSLPRSWLFVFVYALTPLSTTALFLATGLGRVHLRQVVPPFFAGKFAIDAVMLSSGRYAVDNVDDLVHGSISWKGLGTTAAGLAVLALLLFVDWRCLLEHRKLRFGFRILK